MSYIYWDPTLGGQLIKILMYLCVIYVIFQKKLKSPRDSKLFPYVLCFTFIPFLSIIPAMLVHNQSFSACMYGNQMHLMYFFFPLLYYWQVNPKDILKAFIVLGVLWCLIEIIQQISYPQFWFATRMETEDKSLEIRNGIYRYNVAGREFGLIMLFYCFMQYLKNKKFLYLIGFVLGLVGVYLLATRQIMVAVLICIIYALFACNKIKLSSLVILIGIGYLIYINSSLLFGDFVEMTERVDKDYIRFIAYEFYGLKYNDGNLLQILLGNGDPARESNYQIEIKRYEEQGLWRADIGVVGLYSLYGLFYVVAIVAFFIYCFRNRKYIDLYLQMYLIFMLSTCIMLYHFGGTYERIAIMSFITYLIDKSITKNKNDNVISQNS